jgi:hypothetical protein
MRNNGAPSPSELNESANVKIGVRVRGVRVRLATINVFDPAKDLFRWQRILNDSEKSQE